MCLLGLMLAGGAGGASAQVTLYDYEDLDGRSIDIRQDTPDLKALDFNNDAESVVVHSGTWAFYRNADYGGKHITLGPGTYAKLTDEGFANDKMSAVRLISPDPPQYIIELYANENFEGEKRTIVVDTPELDLADFNNEPSSAVVRSGWWQLFRGLNYQDHNIVLGPGDYPSLRQLGIPENTMSSLRIDHRAIDEAQAAATQIQFIAHTAALRGDVDVLKHMVESGLSPESMSPGGWSLLTRAAANGHLQIAKFLLDEGAGVNTQTATGITPLLAAVAGRHVAIIKLLIARGADTNVIGTSGATPLGVAVVTGDPYVTKILLEAGADPNQAGKAGVTPLFHAIHSKDEDVIKLLLGAGANVDAVNSERLTPLSLAIILGEENIVSRLAFAGANVENESFQSLPPLELAVARNQKAIAEFLSKFTGRKIPIAKAEPTLEALAFAITRGDVEEVRLQLDAGLDPNQRLDQDWTPLMFAAAYDVPSIVEALLQAGANANADSGSGVTALHVAARNGHTGSADKLAVAGVDPSVATTNGVTPVDMAREAAHYDLAASLMEHTANGSLARTNFVRQVQSLLYLRGFKVGEIDGVASAQTSEAAQQFQWGLHGVGDGELTEELTRELWEQDGNSGPVGNNWGAIVADYNTDYSTGTWRHDEEGPALSAAIENCLKKANECEVRRTFLNQCFAFAHRDGGWSFDFGDTIWAARENALAACKSYTNGECRLSWEFCTDGSFN